MSLLHNRPREPRRSRSTARRRLVSTTGLAGILTAICLAHLPCATSFAQQQPPPAAQWRHYPAEPAAPAGAPNVLLVMTDDVRFAASRTFGGPIPTPTFDALAQSGLRYNQFHTTAMCSPTRAALLTGRNPHAVATGALTNVSIDAPGYTSVIPKSAATVARVLRDNGYDTAFFGKNHNTPEWETGPLGPFDHWPTGWGFTYFYGFNAAAADGVSMVYSFDQRNAPSHRREQYFEMLGNRGYYKDGWFAATTPGRAPWDRNPTPTDPAQFAWELYDLRTDFSQTRNVAAAHPEKLAELRADFAAAAARYNVEPITSDLIGRVGREHRPSLLGARTRYVYYPGETRYPPTSFPSLAAGWTLGADIVVDQQGASGPIVVQGDEFGGMGLMLQDGRPVYIYNPTGREADRVILQGTSVVAPGSHRVTIAVEPAPEAGPRAARVTLSVDGRAEARADVQVYYRSRGEGVVGRYGVKELVAGMEAREPAGYQIRLVEFARDPD